MKGIVRLPSDFETNPIELQKISKVCMLVAKCGEDVAVDALIRQKDYESVAISLTITSIINTFLRDDIPKFKG